MHKYHVGERVKIIEAKDQHLHIKYLELKDHINKKGEILDVISVPMEGLGELEGYLETIVMYKIALDNGIVLDPVLEDALSKAEDMEE